MVYRYVTGDDFNAPIQVVETTVPPYKVQTRIISFHGHVWQAVTRRLIHVVKVRNLEHDLPLVDL